MVLGLAYIIAEYCTQSHLATEHYHSSCNGLRQTRWFKKYTYWLRSLLGLGEGIVLLVWNVARKATKRQPTAFRKTLVWKWKLKPRSADGRPARVQDRRSARVSDEQEEEYHFPDREQHGTRDGRPLPRLRILPPPRNPSPTISIPRDYTHSNPPSPSANAS